MSTPKIIEAALPDDVVARLPSLLGAVTHDAARVTLWLADGVRVVRPVRDGESAEQAAEKMLDALGEYVGAIAAKAMKR